MSARCTMCRNAQCIVGGAVFVRCAVCGALSAARAHHAVLLWGCHGGGGGCRTVRRFFRASRECTLVIRPSQTPSCANSAQDSWLTRDILMWGSLSNEQGRVCRTRHAPEHSLGQICAILPLVTQEHSEMGRRRMCM